MTTPPQRGGGKPRKAPSDPTFHPSRDEPHWIGDVTKTGQGVMLDQGEDPARLTLFGAQGRSSPSGEWMEPENRSRLQDVRGESGEPDYGLTETLKGVGQSRVPVSHWQRGRGDIDLVNKGVDQAAGYYSPGVGTKLASGRIIPPTPEIGVETSMLSQPESTLLHEMGHAHHYDTVKATKERGNPSKIYKDARGFSTDPIKEAVADAYVDRYGGRHSGAKVEGDYSHINNNQFGYSARYEESRGELAVWDDPDRALYAGTRAHAGETGDIPRYQKAPVTAKPLGAETDTTIHHLMQHSPHARAAWSQLELGGHKNIGGSEPWVDDYYAEKLGPTRSMMDVAQAASRRHLDRRLLSEGQFVQPSLFGEKHMERNQLGEIPRTIRDVEGTLGSLSTWPRGFEKE